MKKLILILFLISNVAFSANYKLRSISQVSDSSILFEGFIDEKSFELLKDVYYSSEKKPKNLKINSEGGEIKYGILIAQWIRQNKMSVEVMDYCISSCANYIFPAGVKKYLHKNSLLLWHGGSFQKEYESEAVLTLLTDDYLKVHGVKSEDFEANRNATLLDISLNRQEEKKLYEALHIDPNFPTYGQSENCKKKYFQENFEGYYYSLDDLKVMGVKNIYLLDKLWEPYANTYAIKNVYRVQPSNQKECEITKVNSPQILYGFVSHYGAGSFIKTLNAEELKKYYFETPDKKMTNIYFDSSLQMLIFVNELKMDVKPNEMFFADEENSIILTCKGFLAKKVFFDVYKFESYISRYVFKGKAIKDILINKDACLKYI